MHLKFFGYKTQQCLSRNPGGTEEKPWCFVDDKSFEKIMEPCNIPKCSDNIWLYIFLTIVTVSGLLLIYVVLVLSRRRRGNEMTSIQNVKYFLFSIFMSILTRIHNQYR